MTIAEKLTQVAENVPKVYEAGQRSMVDESKIIEKTISGQVLSLDDVSEIPHEVRVQLSSDTVTDFSGVAVNVFGKNIFSNVATSSVNNALTVINSTTYSVTPNMGNGTMYGIYADVSALPLDVGDVLKCRVRSISKIGATYGWRVEYQDGTYSSTSNSLKATLTVDKPFKRIMLYCDMGTAGFSYEPVIFTDVVVYKESDVKMYTANSDGSVNVKSISPYMTIFTEALGIDITTATYHKSWGMQTEYDRFWDAFQKNGTLTDYSFAFGGQSVNDAWYNPKYPIIAASSTNMFRNSKITDTKVDIDVSGSNGTYAFNNAEKLVTVRKLIVDEVTVFTGWFAYCSALEEIRFGGVIGQSLDIHWSTRLSFESIDNITACLSGSSTIAEFTLTLPTTAKSVYEAHYGEGIWDFLKSEKPKCTIQFL